jgi:parallel beta-helix repeat protein
MQAALDYVNTAGGGRCHITPAEYLIATTLLLYANTRLSGEGWKSILKQANSAGVDILRNKNHGVSVDEDIVIEDLSLDGNTASNASTTVDCINFNKALRFKIERCEIKNSCRFGIRATGSGVGVISKNKVSGTDSTAISITTGADDTQIVQNDVGSSGAIGINLNDVANCSVAENNVFLCATHGIDVTSGKRNQIVANNVHDNTQNGIRVTSGATANTGNLNSIVANSIEGNNTGNSSSFAQVLLTANAGVAARGNVVSANNITVAGTNDTGVKESTGSVDYSVIVANAFNLISGTAIATIGANTVNANNTSFT